MLRRNTPLHPRWRTAPPIQTSIVFAPISVACPPNSACCVCVTLPFANRRSNTRRHSRNGRPPTTTCLLDPLQNGGTAKTMATAALPQTSLFPLEVSLPPKEESSLSSKAMLCTVSISAWSGYKYDREASEEIAEIHGADKDSG